MSTAILEFLQGFYIIGQIMIWVAVGLCLLAIVTTSFATVLCGIEYGARKAWYSMVVAKCNRQTR